MTEWWTYQLSDFLLFSPRTYWRMFELHNEALWPLHLLTLAIGAAAIALATLRPRRHGLLIALLLAMLWAFVGWSFLWQRYATINWAAAYAAPLFALEALLLIDRRQDGPFVFRSTRDATHRGIRIDHLCPGWLPGARAFVRTGMDGG